MQLLAKKNWAKKYLWVHYYCTQLAILKRNQEYKDAARMKIRRKFSFTPKDLRVLTFAA